MDENWIKLTPEEKRQRRYEWFLSTDGLKFDSKEAEESYRRRTQRMVDVYQVKEPDRVPVSVSVGVTPAYLDGTDFHTVMYDYERLKQAWNKFNLEYTDLDSFATPAMVLPAKVYDLLDYKLYAWPGHGLPTNATGIQFVEGEYMKADEYDALIKNPSDFWQRVYMPRIFGAFASWKTLNPWTNIIELPAMHFMSYTRPDVQESLQRLIDIGKDLSKWQQFVGEFMMRSIAAGFPGMRGTFAKAPFDVIGDTLRGTRGIMFDMFRQPDKLLEAIDVVTALMIDSIVSSSNASRGMLALFPLHKGADGWMSDKQFAKFYWPSLKRVIEACIDEGILVSLFAEGSYETRLSSVNEFPKGAVHWMFDKTDMAKAKKALGDKCSISGNVPTSLLLTGTPQQVMEHCRKLIEICAPGGGYILSPGAHSDIINIENTRAMVEAAKEYGVYRK
jgi:hypothetical protein